MPIISRDPMGVRHSLNTISEVGRVLQNRETLLRPDGSAANVEMFMGGILVDGLPLNVIFDGQWIAGQKEALQAAGRAIAPEVAALPTITSSPNYLLIGIAAFVLWRMFK